MERSESDFLFEEVVDDGWILREAQPGMVEVSLLTTMSSAATTARSCTIISRYGNCCSSNSAVAATMRRGREVGQLKFT